MTLQSQSEWFERLFADALGVLNNRAVDYAPGRVPLLNVLDTCVKRNLTPPQVLAVLLDKQTTAVNRFIAEGTLDSDPIRSRIIDTINYYAFILFWAEHRVVLLAAWRKYWETNSDASISRREVIEWIDKQVLTGHVGRRAGSRKPRHTCTGGSPRGCDACAAESRR